MLPKEKLNKMKTFKSMNPIGSNLDKTVLEKFLSQQKTLLELLQQAEKVSLTKNKTGISISKWIKLKLGDTFRIVIYHNLRHVIQAEKVIKEASR
ncbi:MAG TPA: DinB family protein [Flavobacteriales bacterium]|nr:DinB family protein [Flavobacteriales bacterium]